MLSPDNSTQTTGPIERVSRPLSHRDILNERRQSKLHQTHTDTLPGLHSDIPGGKVAWQQVVQLREENRRLRSLLAEFEKDVAAIHRGNQQELEDYQSHLREIMEEQNGLQEAYMQLERRYQELYHSFQSAVEEEARDMVSEAARTIELTPEDRPAFMNDAMKTVELHVRQLEDKHTAEALYLMRQAQRKAAKLEKELALERQHVFDEEQKVAAQQNSIHEQAKLRRQMMEAGLRARWTLALTLITTIVLLILPIFQTILFSAFQIPLTMPIMLALVAPILLCIMLAAVFAHLRASAAVIYESAPHKHKATANALASSTEKKNA